ncbi:orotidine-5'-phosphate decarboxylase [Neobacillus sp. C211]|jgi:orotidine-5'-phosphate decarboxylase|uniref:Orotidine 5'-phosphate decarboxylase n=1 Tax=Priestia megaterium TaxID=1404 RepID=A0A6H1P1F5_PRIMG|nr:MULTISPECIES: orotidine-5'-phosphate decarboxylase [Bacillaceae]MBT2697766.1 orotidine-5'-phosphate decarboxylase [Bacillus sp. ISL-40]MBT2735473.1 orotidine-5'-phosphate decarboxylase [Bacillus sp. ISL-7]MBT2740175.1 orotidine-5'-phosphate decarboxylase [Bacillus sp. ISL-77]QIZ07389.1 orotidine-5'-phosphate decarboxylase [Priestia megaterium]
MDNSLIIALDFANGSEVNRFLQPFEGKELFVKVGMELFYQEGPSIVHQLKEKGHHIFLDLKLHDIPNTVKSAMKGLARLECDLVNVHAAGGKEMMAAALEGLEAGTSAGRKRPDCIAVTQLTSTSEEQMNKEQLIPVSLEESVLHYALLTKEAGLDGIVCSAWEAAFIREKAGQSFLTVCPGIRMESDQVGDQKRVATPEFARNSGVSSIVVGRSITRSVDPVKSYEKWMEAWKGIRQ